jgi:hypothetical protein
MKLRHILSKLVKEAVSQRLKEAPITPIDPGPGQEPEGETPEAEVPQGEAETPATPAGAISTEEAKQLIKDTKGKFFTVTFTKKDGTTRVMNARLGVKAYLKGGDLPYDPDTKGLIPVYDMKNNGYRMINVNTISNLKIGSNEYQVQ